MITRIANLRADQPIPATVTVQLPKARQTIGDLRNSPFKSSGITQALKLQKGGANTPHA